MSKVRTYGGDERILATSSDKISVERGKDDPCRGDSMIRAKMQGSGEGMQMG